MGLVLPFTSSHHNNPTWFPRNCTPSPRFHPIDVLLKNKFHRQRRWWQNSSHQLIGRSETWLLTVSTCQSHLLTSHHKRKETSRKRRPSSYANYSNLQVSPIKRRDQTLFGRMGRAPIWIRIQLSFELLLTGTSSLVLISGYMVRATAGALILSISGVLICTPNVSGFLGRI